VFYTAVAERYRLVELVEHGATRRDQAIPTDALEHLLHQIWPLSRFAEQRLAREVHHHFFGADGNEGDGCAHEDAPRFDAGCGYVHNLQFTGSIGLEDLFHGAEL
jgi:hypothetical protein